MIANVLPAVLALLAEGVGFDVENAAIEISVIQKNGRAIDVDESLNHVNCSCPWVVPANSGHVSNHTRFELGSQVRFEFLNLAMLRANQLTGDGKRKPGGFGGRAGTDFDKDFHDGADIVNNAVNVREGGFWIEFCG
jgi:hypothetical protein